MQSEAILSVQEQQFLDAVAQAITSKQLQRLTLSQYQGDLAELEKITLRLLEVQQQTVLSALYHYKTKDVTQNYELDQALLQITALLAQCKQANFVSFDAEWQLKRTKKSVLVKCHKRESVEKTAVSSQQHDREKKRLLDPNSPFLHYLGICDAEAKVIPSMARKWKQINKFVEIFSHAVESLPKQSRAMHVVDFGSGKGYLTFALYDYLQKQQHQPQVTGVELSDKMVAFCQEVAAKSQFQQLQFFQGDVRSYQPEHLDVMIALHACDIATDFAIHTGIRLGASVIMCAPCCHKELRPQMQSPSLLKPMLQFGIHAGQQAEMLTDTIRALLLKAYGYETKVFEFVALEHTSKNKMILATKRKDISTPDAEVIAQIQALKQHYSIEQHSLELLLNNQWQAHDLGKKC